MQSQQEQSRENDFLLASSNGRAEVVWVLDFTDQSTRLVRDILHRSLDRFARYYRKVRAVPLPADENSPGAELAARAAIAAEMQGHYEEIHSALFEHSGPFTEPEMFRIAGEIGLDLETFKRDLDSPETRETLKNLRREFGQPVVRGQPRMFIDGEIYSGNWDESSVSDALQKPLGFRIKLASTRFFEWAAAGGFVLVLATVAALLFVNFGGADLHHHFREIDLGFVFGTSAFTLPIEAWVNDGLMAVFFLLVGIEIKREIVNGELSSIDQAILPVIAAVGGMVVPALIYFVVNQGSEAAHGWGVPMATDIAFTLGLMAMLGSRVPTSLKLFVSALAIVDDLGAILVIAAFYGHGFNPEPLIAASAVFAVMLLLNWIRVYKYWPYLLLSLALWFFIHESGIHATIAGVLTAAAIPSRPEATLEGTVMHASDLIEKDRNDRSDGMISDGTVLKLRAMVDSLREPGFYVQHALENWTNFLILPLFAFLGTGIVLTSDISLLNSAAIGTILGLFVGKPVGIVVSVFLAARLGLARLSSEITWAQLFGAGLLAGVGFTMSIFIGTAAFDGEQLESVKLAILVASSMSAVAGVLCLRLASNSPTKGRE